MRRRARAARFGGISTLVVGVTLGLVVGVGLSADPAAGAASAPTVAEGFYLAVGASGSVGYQPTPTDPRGQRTDAGYANDLVALEATRGMALELHQVGCPGETTDSMLGGGDRCYPAPTTQLGAAVTFLRAHRDDVGLVTVDLGFNDLVRCLHHHVLNEPCIDRRMVLVETQLPEILAQLRGAAGPRVRFVGVGHDDPFLASSLAGPTGQAFAAQSVVVMDDLENALHAAYAAAGIPTANVAAAFETQDSSAVTRPDLGRVPSDVARICEWTWMCARAPLGPNLHPNDAGYEVIARAIAAELPASW